jgi:hypothetical protein
MTISEASHQATVIQWRDWMEPSHPELRWLFSSLNGVPLPPQTAKRMKREGMTKGIPDLCLPLARQGYACLWIEMKRSGGRVRKEQAEFLDFVTQQGHLGTVCVGSGDAIDTIKWYLGIEEE